MNPKDKYMEFDNAANETLGKIINLETTISWFIEHGATRVPEALQKKIGDLHYAYNSMRKQAEELLPEVDDSGTQ